MTRRALLSLAAVPLMNENRDVRGKARVCQVRVDVPGRDNRRSVVLRGVTDIRPGQSADGRDGGNYGGSSAGLSSGP